MSKDIANTELIKLAAEVMNPKKISDLLVGQVGAALVTDKGNIYKGVCLDTGSGLGFCAERTAISQMITNKEYKIKKIVAVWNDNPEKDLYILPPCGVCRHYMFMLSEDALDIDVVLGSNKTVKLKELYPEHEWPEKEEGLNQKIVG
jgi:cytidine deaminase